MSNIEDDSLSDRKLEAQATQKEEEAVEEPAVKPAPPKGPTFPDGGFRAWMIILGCFLLSFTSYGTDSSDYKSPITQISLIGQLNAYGVFQTYYIENQLSAHSAADIAWIGNIQLGLMYLTGTVSGWAFDSFGSRVSELSFRIGRKS